MAPVGIALLLVFVVGAAVGIYALAAPRRRAAARAAHSPARAPLRVEAAWTSAAGEEFAGLPESARCDMIFAVAALDDDRSRQLLVHALDDPSEAVSTAAAHALASQGRTETVERYFADHPGERAERIARTLALLRPES